MQPHWQVRGVVAVVVDLAAGAPDATKLKVTRDRQINAILIDFIEIGRVGIGGSSRSFMP
jgi:hypothetical protein